MDCSQTHISSSLYALNVKQFSAKDKTLECTDNFL